MRMTQFTDGSGKLLPQERLSTISAETRAAHVDNSVQYDNDDKFNVIDCVYVCMYLCRYVCL